MEGLSGAVVLLQVFPHDRTIYEAQRERHVIILDFDIYAYLGVVVARDEELGFVVSVILWCVYG